MKAKIQLIIALAITVILSGCDLERTPYNEISTEKINAESVETITLGSYAKMKEEYYYKSQHYPNEYGGDNISFTQGSSNDHLYFLYRYQRQTDNNYTNNIWRISFPIIVNINSVIEKIDENNPDPEMREILGENYFLRGYHFFTLCNIFGRPYVQSPETNLGIPLKLTSDPKDFPARSTVKKVYEQVIHDMEKGASLMQSHEERINDKKDKKMNIYASKEAAYAFLSRVYLYMEDWENAKKYADLVIESGKHSLLTGNDYKQYPIHVPENNSETIFAIRMMKDTDYTKYHMAGYSVGSLYSVVNGDGWGEMFPSESYLELIRENESDLRHGFIKDQVLEDNSWWLIYVQGNESKKTYNYITNKVVKEGNSYKITESPSTYKNATVQTEESNGRTRYFVERADDGKKYYVHIERATQKASDSFPKRYIMKCSQQEGQGQLWSPVLMRLAEVYLNRAEANYHLKDDKAAIDDINVIRERAEIPLRKLSSLSDGKTVLDWVLEERRLELAWEGQRKLDIFRNGQTLDRKYPGVHLTGQDASIYLTIEPTDPSIVELIPKRELDAYPIPLEQNP